MQNPVMVYAHIYDFSDVEMVDTLYLSKNIVSSQVRGTIQLNNIHYEKKIPGINSKQL